MPSVTGRRSPVSHVPVPGCRLLASAVLPETVDWRPETITVAP